MVSALLSRCLILVLGTLYPAYKSYKAIKNKDVREHVKWMMYWIVFALFTTLETFLDIFVSWFPFYYEIKIIFILWVLSPATRGSSLLYKNVVHPMLISREKEIDDLIEKTKQQGYSTFVQLFSSGFTYASNVFVSSAMSGQALLGSQLKKSLSMNDVNVTANLNNTNNTTTTNTVNTKNKKIIHTITEDEITEDHDIVGEDYTDAVQPKPKTVRTTSSSRVKSNSVSHTLSINANNNINNDYLRRERDFELIDDDEIETQPLTRTKSSTVTKKRTNSSKNATNGSSIYKTTESSHYGTLTRGKVLKSKSQTNGLYDENDDI